jgi:hypothetical protein
MPWRYRRIATFWIPRTTGTATLVDSSAGREKATTPATSVPHSTSNDVECFLALLRVTGERTVAESEPSRFARVVHDTTGRNEQQRARPSTYQHGAAFFEGCTSRGDRQSGMLVRLP